MTPSEAVWQLYAKKLAGEATLAEQIQLSDLIKRYPEIKARLQFFSTLWDNWKIRKEHSDSEAEAAFERLCRRIGLVYS